MMAHLHSRDHSLSSSNTTYDSKGESESQGYTSSPNSTPPPTLADIDRWRYHIDFSDFGKSLQDAANAVFPNDTNSRYTEVSVLILSWEDEDPRLPVSQEIRNLYNLFYEVYSYETERWTIPDEHSHWKLTEKIMDFVKPTEDSKTHLKIVYYAGHARLTDTRLLVWTSWRNNKKAKCPMVKWGGIQTILEESPSDVLILLDCCASGTANASEGNGVNELISACAFNETANGVGPYSFTSALVTELRLLSNKPSFSVGELYKKIFFRTQCRMPEEMYGDGTHRERHPAPIHLALSHGESSPRGIQLPASVGPQRLLMKQNSTQSGTPLFSSFENQHNSNGSHSQESGRGASFSTLSDDKPATDGRLLLNLPPTAETPRLLFSIRLRETFQPGESMIELFTEWIRNFPTIADEMKVEASFDSHSTLVIMSLPLSVAAYLPQDPSIISLGPITSGNRMDYWPVWQPFEQDQYTNVHKSSLDGLGANISKTHHEQNAAPGPKHLRSWSLPDNTQDMQSRDSIQSMSSYSSYLSDRSLKSDRSSMNTLYSRSSRTLESLSEVAGPSFQNKRPRPYKCPMCDMTFTRPSDQERHFKVIHSEKSQAIHPTQWPRGFDHEPHQIIQSTSKETKNSAMEIDVPEFERLFVEMGVPEFRFVEMDVPWKPGMYTCLLGTCTPECGFPCFNSHHFQTFQTRVDRPDMMKSHLMDIHGLDVLTKDIPESWSDTYNHSKDGWSCARCKEFLGTWPANKERIEAHFKKSCVESPGTMPERKAAPRPTIRPNIPGAMSSREDSDNMLRRLW